MSACRYIERRDSLNQVEVVFMLLETVYDAPHCSIKLNPYAIFVDTNVWVSAFDPNDLKHDYAQYFLEDTQGPILVPICVVVETWGMLVNRPTYSVDKQILWERGIAFLAWLADPGHNVRLIPEINDSANYIIDLSRSLHIDCVDAMLAHLASKQPTCPRKS